MGSVTARILQFFGCDQTRFTNKTFTTLCVAEYATVFVDFALDHDEFLHLLHTNLLQVLCR